jgi:hypothetical protein
MSTKQANEIIEKSEVQISKYNGKIKIGIISQEERLEERIRNRKMKS